MPAPPLHLAPDARLRSELVALLHGRNAHVDAATSLRGIPPDRVNERAAGVPHSLWDLVEHLRLAQADLLEFCQGPDYAEKDWPDAYWPAYDATPEQWAETVGMFLADLDEFVTLVEGGDLFTEFSWAPGYTLLRETLLAADHNAHHLGQVVLLRRHLGLWPPADGDRG